MELLLLLNLSKLW